MLLDQLIEQKKGALRADHIAQILDLSAKQIYKMAATGEIPSLRIAKTVRFDPHDFAEWLRSRSSGSSSGVGGSGYAADSLGKRRSKFRRNPRI